MAEVNFIQVLTFNSRLRIFIPEVIHYKNKRSPLTKLCPMDIRSTVVIFISLKIIPDIKVFPILSYIHQLTYIYSIFAKNRSRKFDINCAIPSLLQIRSGYGNFRSLIQVMTFGTLRLNLKGDN